MSTLAQFDVSDLDDSLFEGLPKATPQDIQLSSVAASLQAPKSEDALFEGLPKSPAPALQKAVTRNPDAVADAARIAKNKGVSVDLVERNYAQMSAQEKAEKNQRLLEAMGAGGTADFMLNPTNAGMAHDDVEALAEVERSSNMFKEAARSVRRAPDVTLKFLHDSAGFLSGVMDSYAEDVEKVTGFKRGGLFEQWQNASFAEAEYHERRLNNGHLAIPKYLQTPLVNEDWEVDWDKLSQLEYLTSQMGQAAESMVPMILTYAASGGSIPAASFMGGLQEAAPTFRELVQDGVDKETAARAATSYGLVVALLDKIGLDELVKKIPPRTILHNLARRGAAGAIEGFTEYLEEPFQAAFTAAAKGKDAKGIINDVVASLRNVEVGIGAFLFGSSGAMSKTAERVEKKAKSAHAGTQNYERLKALSDAVAVSKLGQRAPEKLGEFVDSVLPEEAKEQFIEAQQLVTVFQEAISDASGEGLDIASPEEVLSRLEVSPKAFQEALVQDTVMSLSVPKLMQTLTKDELELILPHMKETPLSMSEAESVQFDWQAVAQQEFERYEMDTEREIALASEQARVVAGLVEQGVREEDASQMAFVPLAFARAWESYGLDGVDFMQRLQVGNVGAETQAGLWQDERGSLSFLPDSKYLIKLAANSDNSTFLHECAHVFLAEMSRVTGQTQVFEQETSSPALEAMMEEEELLGENMNAAAEDSDNARDPEGVLYAKKIKGWDTMGIGLRVSAIEADYFASLKDLEHRYNKEKDRLRTEIKADPVSSLPSQLQKDMATLRKWLNLQEGSAIATAQHEQFARGFEAYLREGKAPSADLVQVFHKFRKWLVSIYKDIKGLNVEINDEVRDVFDRMLATDEQIAEARYVNDMVASERERLEELDADAHDIAFLEKLMSETEREAVSAMDRATQRDRKKRKSAAKKEARGIVDDEPVYQHITSITKGSGLDEAHMLEYYGKDTVADIRKKHRGLIKKNGQMADDIASELGYDDSDHMVYAFVDAPRRTERVNQLAEELFAAEETQVNPDEIVLAGEAYGKYLESYNAMLSKKIRSKTYSPRDYLRRFVKEKSGATVIREAMRYYVHQHTMRKHSRLREEAAKKGDANAEAFHLEKVRLAHEFIGESVRVREEVQKIVNRAKNLAKNKSGLDFHYRDHIRTLVQRFGMGGRSLLPKNPAEMSSLRTLLEAEKDINEVPPSFPEWLVDGTEQVNWKDLTVDQLRAVNNLIQFLDHRGRKTRKENKAVSKERVDNAAEAGIAHVEGNERKKYEYGSIQRKVVDAKDEFLASMNTLYFILDAFDGYVSIGKDGKHGVNTEMIYDALVECQDNDSRMWNEMWEKCGDAFLHLHRTAQQWEKQHGKKFSRLKLTAGLRDGVHRELGSQIKEGANTSLDTQEFLELDVPAIMQQDGRKWTPDAILGLMLHTGTKSNLERVFAGYPELKEGQTLAYLKSMLTHKDWDAIQQIWDAIDSLYPQLDVVHKKMNGFHMTKIEAQPFGIERGGVVKKYQGGYFPVKYDSTLPQTHFVKQYTELDSLLSRAEAINQTPAARSGFTQGRKNKAPGFPLRLSVDVAAEHLRETIHYMTHAEALRFVDRLTKHKKWEKAFIDVMGQEAYRALRGHLKSIAMPEQLPPEYVNKWWYRMGEKMRVGATTFILSWNFGVATKQVFSLPGGVHDIGMKDFCKGLKTVMTNSPMRKMKWIHEVSPYMRDRAGSMDREFLDIARKFKMDVKTVSIFGKDVSHQDVVDFGFWPIRLADMATTYVLWIGAYEKAMGQSKDPEKAVRYADNIIRKSQPSSNPIDQTMLQRDKRLWMRWFTLFQTYLGRTYFTRQVHHFSAWKKKAMSHSEYVKYLLYDQIFPPVAMTLMMALMWGNAPDPDDDEAMKDFMMDIGLGTAAYQAAGIPIAGNWFTPFEAAKSPAGVGIELVEKAFKKGINYASDPSERRADDVMWALFHLGSFATRVPISRVAQRSKKGLDQYLEDEGTPVNILIPEPKK